MTFDLDQLDDDVLSFLSEYHLATLTTMRSDGTPQVTPVGVTYRSGDQDRPGHHLGGLGQGPQHRPGSRAAGSRLSGRRRPVAGPLRRGSGHRPIRPGGRGCPAVRRALPATEGTRRSGGDRDLGRLVGRSGLSITRAVRTRSDGLSPDPIRTSRVTLFPMTEFVPIEGGDIDWAILSNPPHGPHRSCTLTPDAAQWSAALEKQQICAARPTRQRCWDVIHWFRPRTAR